MHNSNKASKEA